MAKIKVLDINGNWVWLDTTTNQTTSITPLTGTIQVNTTRSVGGDKNTKRGRTLIARNLVLNYNNRQTKVHNYGDLTRRLKLKQLTVSVDNTGEPIINLTDYNPGVEAPMKPYTPLEEFYIGAKVLDLPFKFGSKAVQYGLGRYGSKFGWDEALLSARNKILSDIFDKESLRLKTPQATTLLYLTLKFNPTITPNKEGALTFFQRNPSKISAAERMGVPKGERNFTLKWHIANYPGYLLKGLMRGSLLERQLSKNGTININLLNAYFNKASQIEKEVANKVLSEKFAGLKTIDYNLFKKAVLDELIGKYNRVPLTNYADYGIERLGYNLKTVGENELPGLPNLIVLGLPIHYIPPGTKADPISLSTFTFESPNIPVGSAKHYDASTLGHSRTYTTSEEPKVLHVMESQSDWGQSHVKMMPSVLAHQIAIEKALKSGNINAFHSFTNRLSSLLAGKLTKYERMALENINKEIESGLPSGFSTIEDLWNKKYEILKRTGNRSDIGVLGLHLHDNYLQRQLQENLRYAAENGLTKMRYPTSETAAKIEGYLSKTGWFTPEGKELNPLTSALFNPATENFEAPIGTVVKQVYAPEHQTILKKYADFPKLFLKLYKDLKVRTVTDAKGNTWYEVDVPKGYLNSEWQFKKGGILNFLR